MISATMYRNLKKLKKKGLNRREVARRLGVDPRTVSKYWNMSGRDYIEYRKVAYRRGSVFSPFKNEIQSLQSATKIKLTAAALYDVLEEKHGAMPGNERAFRNYISRLRGCKDLVVDRKTRRYMTVPEVAPGKQLQLDFGEFQTASGMKLYFQAAVLAHSRTKFVLFQDHPVTTIDAILFLLFCFKEIGGRPDEIVIDQDAVLVHSENYGDIIYTSKFESFLSEQQLKMYVCRKADPETKGKIENVVGYIKKNFLAPRQFSTIDEVNQRCRSWLKRRANGRPSAATGRVPADLLPNEQKCLRPTKRSIFTLEEDNDGFLDSRAVDSLGRISVQAVKYEVPYDYVGERVDIKVCDGRLYIYDPNTSAEIANYLLGDSTVTPFRKNWRRMKANKAKAAIEKLAQRFDIKEWREFIEENYKRFNRYLRDQHRLARKCFDEKTDIEALAEAIALCAETQTYSFRTLQDTYRAILERNSQNQLTVEIPVIPGLKTKYPEHLVVATRDIGEYIARSRGEDS